LLSGRTPPTAAPDLSAATRHGLPLARATQVPAAVAADFAGRAVSRTPRTLPTTLLGRDAGSPRAERRLRARCEVKQRQVAVLARFRRAAPRPPVSSQPARGGQGSPGAPTKRRAARHPLVGARNRRRSSRAAPSPGLQFRLRSAGCPRRSGGRAVAPEGDSTLADVWVNSKFYAVRCRAGRRAERLERSHDRLALSATAALGAPSWCGLQPSAGSVPSAESVSVGTLLPLASRRTRRLPAVSAHLVALALLDTRRPVVSA
jgi:hypothetical protein